jgi:hypothetical protein
MFSIDIPGSSQDGDRAAAAMGFVLRLHVVLTGNRYRGFA